MTRYNVWLDQLGLQDIDPAIYITDVQEQPSSQLFTTAARAGGDGLFLTRRARQSLSVTVCFAIRETRPERRQAILQKVRAWAQQGSYLSTSDRPHQRLRVEPEVLPALQSALKWTEALSLTFTAYTAPYWEEDVPATATSAHPMLTLPGDAASAPLDLRWPCTATETGTLTITTPMSGITFQDVPLAAGQELIISHESGWLTATLGGVDVLPFRTPDSSDDLLLPCGQTSTVSFTLNGAAAEGCTFSARGRWL